MSIPFDHMLRGNLVRRGRETVRQFAILVEGCLYVATSGEPVERRIYEALLACGAVRPLPAEASPAPAPVIAPHGAPLPQAGA